MKNSVNRPTVTGQFLPRTMACLLILLFALSACTRNAGLPKPESKEYRELVTAFYVGLAGLQTGEDTRAKEKLTLATQIAPGEPASWANLGLFHVRQQEFDAAYENVEKARALAPDNSQIETLLGFIESKRGKLPEAIAHFKKAVELDGKNLKALYALAQETERQSTDTSDADAQKLLENVLAVQPDNTAVLLDVIRLAAKRGDSEEVQKALARLNEKSASWPEEAKQQLATLQQTASGNVRAAAAQSAFLKNVLARVPDFRQNLNAVKTPPEFVGDPFLKFIKLPSPNSAPAAPDLAMTFEGKDVVSAGVPNANWYGAISLDGENQPVTAIGNYYSLQLGNQTKFEFPGAPPIDYGTGDEPLLNGILALDINYDFKTDFVLAGQARLRVYEQSGRGEFTNITSRLKLNDLSRLGTSGFLGAWAIDVDLDGDLDVLLGGSGLSLLLRNNGDGTFKELTPKDNPSWPFQGIIQIGAFATADFDSDGDPDVGLVNGDGELFIFSNERLGQYRARPLPQNFGKVIAIAAADINGDGLPDLIALKQDKSIVRLSDKLAGNEWEIKEIAKLNSNWSPHDFLLARVPLFIADLDNNGSLDLVADHQVLLSDEKGGFIALSTVLPIKVTNIADVNTDGRLDLLGVNPNGTSVQLINRGTKNYHSQTIRTRAAKSTGDQRINSFGIGGEIEIRSGLLTQKQVITSPLLHFGLGENTQTDVARIVWPNGSVQAEFELKADQSILAEQRLKGSCPMLFAWDGKQISYVKDTAPWSPALGLHINAQIVAGIYQTEEWFKIPGDKLAPRADSSGSYYDLRVTAELWEAYYIDHYSLLVVDHPPGTEVFTDERFAVPPPPLKLYATGTPKAFASAKDDLSQDVSAVVRELDQKYLGTFGKGRYQGVTRDHWVELELPEDAPRDKPLYLIGHGFLHPTDGSINVAYGQMSSTLPQSLSIETPDAQGNWVTAKSGQGFPAGKLKTIVLDLDNIFRPGAPRRLRLRTNMEIYWDKLEWAEALPDATFKTQRINLSSAELRYRGFSKFTQADDSSPELPDYNQLAGTAPKWRDLIGYYTRHGDVRELLEKVDDRIVLVNAGDELRLRFAALPPPPAGWTRDYVMIGDGWIKDGDLNSTFSKTVLPLPYHGMKDYNVPPQRLEDDPAYKRHPQDWQEYHTRYVTPDSFLRALRQ